MAVLGSLKRDYGNIIVASKTFKFKYNIATLFKNLREKV